MSKMIKFLVSAGFAVAFVGCSSESSTQATPTASQGYIKMVASTRCDNTDKDSPCHESGKALRKVNLQNGNFTTVATVFDDASGNSMTVRWKDLSEKFITVPGSNPYNFQGITIGDSASIHKITYTATSILSNGTDAEFAPIYTNDDKYCEESISNESKCIALYPAGDFWYEPGEIVTRIVNRLKTQRYGSYSDNLRDSVAKKYHHMVSAIQPVYDATQDSLYKVQFGHLTSFLEVDLPRTEGVKIVGFKGKGQSWNDNINYEIHFENAIPSEGNSIRVVFAFPSMMSSISGELAFYTKTGENDNAPIVYKRKLKNELQLADSDGKYWSFDFSQITGVQEQQSSSSSSSDQSSSSQGGSEEPENPEESSSSQGGSEDPSETPDASITTKGGSVTFTTAKTYTVYINGPASGYCQINCASEQNEGSISITIKLDQSDPKTGYNLYDLYKTVTDGCKRNFTFDVSGSLPIKCWTDWSN